MNHCDFTTFMSFVQSVTAFGRMMIEQTKNYVEEHYTVANGYEHDAKVFIMSPTLSRLTYRDIFFRCLFILCLSVQLSHFLVYRDESPENNCHSPGGVIMVVAVVVVHRQKL